jgi:hypothetical protein
MGIVQTYKQSRDSRWKLCGTATADGACFALSAWWIIQTSRNASAGFWNWLKPSDYATGGLSNQVNQVDMSDHVQAKAAAVRIYTAMADQSLAIDASDPDIGLTAKIGCVAKIIESNSALRAKRADSVIKTWKLPVFKKDHERNVKVEEWGDKLSKDRGYKYLSLKGYTTLTSDMHLNHGFGVFTGSETYCIFDPNIGEFNADNLSAFKTDLKAIFNWYGLTWPTAYFALFKL